MAIFWPKMAFLPQFLTKWSHLSIKIDELKIWSLGFLQLYKILKIKCTYYKLRNGNILVQNGHYLLFPRKWQYLSTKAGNKISKITLLFFKVKKNTVSLLLSNLNYRQGYGHFFCPEMAFVHSLKQSGLISAPKSQKR